MSTYQKMIIFGHLGADPETRFTQGGQAVCNFRIATSEKWTNKAGEAQERTEWHRIVVFGKQAEAAGEYLKKGQLSLIEGRLQTREYEDKDGNRRFTTECIADKVVFGPSPDGKRGGGGGGSKAASGGSTKRQSSPGPEDSAPLDDADIPF